MIGNKIQDRFRVILLQPKESLNIGSVARAMMNMGFSELVIVSPLDLDPQRASTTARKAKSILDSAQLFSNLDEALAPCTHVAGFSTKDSKNTPPVQILGKWIETVPELSNYSNSKIGLLFGPEDTGLRYEHLPVCNTVVRIPSCDQYDSLNLAQAALLVFYSIMNLEINLKVGQQQPASTAEQYHALDMLIQKIAEDSEFINSGTPENTIGLLKNLFRRPDLSNREMQILLGFFSRISKTIPKI